jgi:hypothetical protein
MTLSDYASLSTAISGMAVTASLIYLAMQTHQNAKHTRALINQGRVALISGLALTATDPEVTSALISATGGAPTQEEVRQTQFRYWCSAAFYGWQDSFSQHERGLLDDDIYLQMRDIIVTALRQPAYRAQWQTNIRVPGTKFAAFVDGVIAGLGAEAGKTFE